MLPNIDFLFSYHLYTYHKRIKVHRRRCPYRFPMNYRNPIESESFAPPGSPWPTRSADFAPGIHSIIPYFHGERSSWTVWLVFSRLKNVYIYTHTHIYIHGISIYYVSNDRINLDIWIIVHTPFSLIKNCYTLYIHRCVHASIRSWIYLLFQTPFYFAACKPSRSIIFSFPCEGIQISGLPVKKISRLD